jgi:hypothetical protein
MSTTMSHNSPHRNQLARWNTFPDTSLGISGVVTHGRCWHRNKECRLYLGPTNRDVTVSRVAEMTAGEAKACGYGLCFECHRLLTSA